MTAAYPELVGEAYQDADGREYLAMLGTPVMVFEGGADELAHARERAQRRDIPLAIYTADMFRTGHDAANRATVSPVSGADLDLVGLALHGPRNAVDKVVKGAHLHP